MPVVIDEITAPTEENIGAVNELITQLSSSAKPISKSDLEEIVADNAAHLLIARDANGNVVGMLTLVLFHIPTGGRAWIEDVVVNEKFRGQGIGEELVRYAIDLAAKHEVRTVDLTSRPSREAANRLYTRVGFNLRETNVYRYSE